MNGSMPKQEPVRHDFSKIRSYMALPNLIDVQRKSYDRFLQMNLLPEEREDTGLQSVFTSVFPFSDFRETCSLDFVKFSIGNWECKCGALKGLEHLRMTCANCGSKIITDHPHEETVNCQKCGVINKNRVEICDICGNPVDLQMKYSVEECQERGMSYSVPLKVTFRLFVYDKDPDTGVKHMRDAKEEEVFFGDIPLMTENGTFIINGTERVIVSQLHRSPGVFFTRESAHTFLAKIIPYRGSWVEFEYDQKNILYVRIDRKRKFLATTFLRAVGYEEKAKVEGPDATVTDSEILRTFYTPVTIRWEGRTLYRTLARDLIGSKAAGEIRDSKGKTVVVAKGKKIVDHVYAQLVKSGVKEIEIEPENLEGALAISEIVNHETGEVLVEPNNEVTSQTINALSEAGINQIEVFFPDRDDTVTTLSLTLKKDNIKSSKEALIEIYRKQRPGDPPTVETATALFEGMFYDPRKYDFSKVGRLKFNIKLGLNTPLEHRTLTAEDFYAVIKYALKLPKNIGAVDDIDHLGNRRVRAVGELLENQFRIGLVRMQRASKVSMSVYEEMSTSTTHDLNNAHR